MTHSDLANQVMACESMGTTEDYRLTQFTVGYTFFTARGPYAFPYQAIP